MELGIQKFKDKADRKEAKIKDPTISDSNDSDNRSQHILIQNEDIDDLVNMEDAADSPKGWPVDSKTQDEAHDS